MRNHGGIVTGLLQIHEVENDFMVGSPVGQRAPQEPVGSHSSGDGELMEALLAVQTIQAIEDLDCSS